MKHVFLILAVLASPAAAPAQDGAKWKPYQFTGNERYEFKLQLIDGEEKKEAGYILDIRKKGEEDWDMSWTTKSVMKRSAQGIELLMGNNALGIAPGMFVMNPFYGAFVEQLELKEGEKLSILGVGIIKVLKKETVGGRSGFSCEMTVKNQETQKDDLVWSFVVDPTLALPLRNVTFEGGKEKSRSELVSYKKD